MKCLRDKLNLSQIWRRGFTLARNHYSNHSNNFWIDNFFKKCAEIVRIATLMKTSFLTVDCLSNHKNERHQVPRRKKFAFIFICSEVMAQTRWRVSIVLWSIPSCHSTRREKCDEFRLPAADRFPAVYTMNDFSAIIFRRNYTLNAWETISQIVWQTTRRCRYQFMWGTQHEYEQHPKLSI